MTVFLTNFCTENSLPITPLMKGPDNEDDVGPLDCPDGLTNITTLIKRSGPLLPRQIVPKFVYFVDLKELRI